STTLPSSKSLASPALNLLGGSLLALGKRKRMEPRVMAASEPVNAVQATPVQVANMENRKKRRVLPPAAALAAGAGLGGAAGRGGAAAGAGAGGVPVTLVVGSDKTARFTPGRLGKERGVGGRPTGNFLVPGGAMSTVFPGGG